MNIIKTNLWLLALVIKSNMWTKSKKGWLAKGSVGHYYRKIRTHLSHRDVIRLIDPVEMELKPWNHQKITMKKHDTFPEAHPSWVEYWIPSLLNLSGLSSGESGGSPCMAVAELLSDPCHWVLGFGHRAWWAPQSFTIQLPTKRLKDGSTNKTNE